MKKINTKISWALSERPRTMEEIVLPDTVRADLQNQNKNILMVGSAGVGKTTVAYYHVRKNIEANDGLRDFYMILNGSKKNKVADVEEIERFVEGAKLYGENRLVVINEIERFSGGAQDRLLELIENNERHTNFIITCNSTSKLTEPLLSRFDVYDFNFQGEQAKSQVNEHGKDVSVMLAKYGFTISDEAKMYVFRRLYPDRRAINRILHTVCSRLHKLGRTNVERSDFGAESVNKYESFWLQVLRMETENVYNAVKTKYVGREVEVLQSFGSSLSSYLVEDFKRFDLVTVTSIIAQKYNNMIRGCEDLNNLLFAACNELGLLIIKQNKEKI